MKKKSLLISISILILFFVFFDVKTHSLRFFHDHLKRKIPDPQNKQFAWMDEQVNNELAFFENGITLEQIEAVCKSSIPLQRFKIIDNKVIGPEGKMKNLLDALCQRYTLQDVDFVYCLDDGFVLEPQTGSLSPPLAAGPVFISAKHETIRHAILFADWYFDPTSKKNSICDWCLVSERVNRYIKKSPWKKKKACAVWRGGFQGCMHDYTPKGFGNTPRGKACLLSIENSSLIDAGTDWGIERPFMHDLLLSGINPKKPFLTHKHQIRYKYIIDIDGHTCTYPGLQWKMLSNCTVIKQQTPNKMWYFSQMQPWVHYVPVKEDMSDLKEKIDWCINNDNAAKCIADKGRELALTSMMPEHCLVYCYKVLSRYAQLQTFTPAL